MRIFQQNLMIFVLSLSVRVAHWLLNMGNYINPYGTEVLPDSKGKEIIHIIKNKMGLSEELI